MRSITFRTDRDKTFKLNDLGWAIELLDVNNAYVRGNINQPSYDLKGQCHIAVGRLDFTVHKDDVANVELFIKNHQEIIDRAHRMSMRAIRPNSYKYR